jgi:spore coat polysaccharide biosynthesis protein SpsF
MPLEGKSLFVRQAERVMAAALCGEVVIATTSHSEDDLIEEICSKEGLSCYRGDANDLLDRHYRAARERHADIVIKIPSDCPLIDPAVIDKTIGVFLDNPGKYDFVSNLHPATYPDGNDVEVIRFAALAEAWVNARQSFEREHTTPYLWERPERFRIGNVVMEGGADYSMTHRFTIDYAEDYAFIRAVFEELFPVKPLFGVWDILALLERRPDIYAINRKWAGVNWYRNHLDELRTIGARQTRIVEEEAGVNRREIEGLNRREVEGVNKRETEGLNRRAIAGPDQQEVEMNQEGAESKSI